jgi:hypothetical protein
MSELADANDHPARLMVVVAFSRVDNGQLVPAYDPMQFDTPEDAARMARYLAGKCVGVLAWVRDVQPDAGGYAAPTILFQSGDVPELE